MPRGRKPKAIIAKDKLQDDNEQKACCFSTDELLKLVKSKGMFKFNKYLGQYELVLSKTDFEAL